MALADLNEYISKVRNPDQLLLPHHQTTLSGANGQTLDGWTGNRPTQGVAPSTAVAPTKATAGALSFQNGGSGRLTVLAAQLAACGTGVQVLCDRLSHQGGLSGTVTTAQTTNLPTAALTRYTSGEGVFIGLSIYTTVGTTATTVTASYTNQAGTSGRTTVAMQFGDGVFRLSLRILLLPLQQGDTGVRSVESVTLAGSTGTAGNFGVTLFKPLSIYNGTTPSLTKHFDLFSGDMAGGLPEILDDAALFWMPAQTLSSNHNLSGLLLASEV